MELAQCRLVTDDVEGLAGFYARLLGVPTALNEYYVEIQAGPASVGFSRRRFTEHREADGPAAPGPAARGPAAPGPAAPGPAAPGPVRRDDIILDFSVDDVDAEYARIAELGVDWVLPPTTQPWGNRSMVFRDPAGNLINVFSRRQVLSWIHDARGHDDDAGVGPGALTAALIEAPGRVLRGFAIPWSLAPHYREEMTMHDHRKLGRELELFDTDPLIGAGLPYWLPAGAAIRHALEEYIREVEWRAGYQHVYSPVLGKRELYEISGHWSHYRDGMYPPMEIGGERVVLRPSLCPHHALIYRSRTRSYRDLPLRMAELGGMYRSELSGVLGGLTRVRAIQLNDAHIFCTPDQVAAEAAAALGLIKQAYLALGIEPARYRLSLPGRDGKYVGDRDVWDRAAGLLEQVLASAGVPYEAEEGEAAFYGPKIDVQVTDSAEREASLSTVQVDFYLPERFGLEYVGADGARHRPVMVHRSIIGSAERAVAHLIDVHGGAFPAWLAPVQLVVLPVADAQRPEAGALAGQAVERGLRAVVARPESGSLGARIHAHRRVPYQAVIGAREAAAGQAALRLRDGRRIPARPSCEVLARIGERIAARSTELWEP